MVRARCNLTGLSFGQLDFFRLKKFRRQSRFPCFSPVLTAKARFAYDCYFSEHNLTVGVINSKPDTIFVSPAVLALRC